MNSVAAFCLTTALVLAALVCIVGSGFASWSFWYAVGTNGADKIMLGTTVLGIDAIKAMLPIAVVWAFANGRYGFVLVGTVMFLVFAAFSLTTALGYVATQRSDSSASVVSVTKQLADAERNATTLEARTKQHNNPGTSGTIDAELSAMRTQRRWDRTKSCTDATESASRRFCGRYQTKLAQLATAISFEADSQKLNVLRDQIRKLRKAGGDREANPQAETIAKLVTVSQLVPKFDAVDAEFGIRIALATLIELGAALGLYFAFNHGGKPGVVPREKPRKKPVKSTIQPVKTTIENSGTVLVPRFDRVPVLLPDDDDRPMQLDYGQAKEAV